MTVRVRCYLDDLNFYYGVCREYDIKWIDLEKLFQTLLCRLVGEEVVIEKLLLFTSTVSGPASDRQKIYFSALEQHSSCVEIIKGFFKKKSVLGPVIVKYDDKKIVLQQPKITVSTREEKQTDVNLACRMVDDAHIWDREKTHSESHQYDIVCLISNDSDLAYALAVKRRLKQGVYLISPISYTPILNPASPPPDPEWRVSGSLKKYIPRKFRLPYIKREDIKTCLLPAKVGELYPPDARGWRI